MANLVNTYRIVSGSCNHRISVSGQQVLVSDAKSVSICYSAKVEDYNIYWVELVDENTIKVRY